MSADTKLLPGTLCRVTQRGSQSVLYRTRWSDPFRPADCLHELEEDHLVTLVSGPLKALGPATLRCWEVYLVTDRGTCGWLRLWDSEVTEASLIVPVDP